MGIAGERSRPGNNIDGQAVCDFCSANRNYQGLKQCFVEILRIDNNGVMPTVEELKAKRVDVTLIPENCPNKFVVRPKLPTIRRLVLK